MTIIQLRRASCAPSRCLAARARRRVSDYSARRAGGEEENARRSRTSREFQSPTHQPGYRNGTGARRSEDYSSFQNSSGYNTRNATRDVQPSPVVRRRKSIDYSSRRSGGQEENQRRSRDFSANNGRTPIYNTGGMAPPSPSVSSAASSPRNPVSSPRVTPRGRPSGSQSPPPWNLPSPSRDTFGSYSQQRETLAGSRKRQSADYATRRSGMQEENLRRSRDYDSPTSSRSAQPRSYSPAPSASSRPPLQESPRGSQPPIMRKPSTDYSSRRSGGQEENQRRSGDYRSPTQTPRRLSSSSYTTEAPSSAHSTGYDSPARRSQPHIERKRSTDYPSRRSGGQEENLRRSQDFSSPAGGRGLSREPATRYDYTPPRTRGTAQEEPRIRGGPSQDFVPLGGDSGRSGGYQDLGSSGSGRGTNYSPRTNGMDENSPPTRAGRANAKRRQSGNYNERRASGVSEENSRRRSVDMITGEVREPSREGPPPRRRSTSAGSTTSDSASSQSYSPSRKVKGVPRQSKDFLTASEVDPWQKRLNPDSESARDPNQVDGPAAPAETDWPRVIAGNLPAAFLVFAGIAAADVYTGFDITRIAVRYGGPGAPPSAVLAFWPTAIAAAGVLSTVLTTVLQLEAFGLKAKCPECGTINRAGFKGGFRGGDYAETARVECENCMADLRFDVQTKTVVVERGSEDKKNEALERGRQQALRIARMEAQEAQREAQQYMDNDPRSK